jgi:hypothetical protein
VSLNHSFDCCERNRRRWQQAIMTCWCMLVEWMTTFGYWKTPLSSTVWDAIHWQLSNRVSLVESWKTIIVWYQ